MSDVVVSDEEYLVVSDAAVSYGNSIEDSIEAYRSQVQQACDNAVPEGRFAQNIKLFHEMTNILTKRTGEATSQVSSLSKAFLDEIDSADKHLY